MRSRHNLVSQNGLDVPYRASPPILDTLPESSRLLTFSGDVASTPFNGIGEYLVTQLLPMAFTAENPPAQGRWSHRNK